MSGTGNIIFTRYINRRTGEYVKEPLRPSSLNLQTDIRNFTGSFDASIEVNKASDLVGLSSHDFIEFFIKLPNGLEHQVGVGFMEDVVDQTSPTQITKDFNGRELIGQLLLPPFAEAKHFKTMTMVAFAQEASKGEYVSQYCKSKGLAPVVGISPYSGKIKVSTDLTQNKGNLLQEYSELAINTVYQNRLGQIVIYGGRGRGTPRGRLIKGKNIEDLRVSSTYSNAVSEIVTFYSSAQSNLDKNKVASPIFINDDSRVRNVVYIPKFRTFSSSDLQMFDVSADKRIGDIARSMIRKSNSYLSPVVISVKEPFYSINNQHTPYEIGQTWTIETPENELRSKEFPNGTDQLDMLLAGIHYSQDEEGLGVQLLFIEQGTLQ